MIDGKKVTINGQEWIVPALSLGQLRGGILEKFKVHDALLAKAQNDDDMVASWNARFVRGEVIVAALSRNYDKDTIDALELDLRNIDLLWPIVLGLSGFQQRDDSEGGGSPLISGNSTTS